MQLHIFPLCSPEAEKAPTDTQVQQTHTSHMYTKPLARAHTDKAESREQAHGHFAATLRGSHITDTLTPQSREELVHL